VIAGSSGLLQRLGDTAIHIAALASGEAQVQPPVCRGVAVRKLICVPNMTSMITCACTFEAVLGKLHQIVSVEGNFGGVWTE